MNDFHFQLIAIWMKSSVNRYYKIKLPFHILLILLYNIALIILWPVYGMIGTFLIKVEYFNSHGLQRAQNHNKMEEAVLISTRAHMIEVCIESSFQVRITVFYKLSTIFESNFRATRDL